MAFERIGGGTVYEGKIFTVKKERFRLDDDGEEGDRGIVEQPRAGAGVGHDGERVYLVRQPREAVDEPALLELPAGKLDEEDEEPLDTAKRELAEEIGKAAASWEFLKSFYTSPGFAAEEVHLFLATDLRDEKAEADENERIEVVEHPLDRVDDAIADCADSKSLVGLLWLKAYLLG